MLRKITLLAILFSLAGFSYSEPIRTTFTRENRLPELYQLEAGSGFDYVQFEAGDETVFTPYLRFAVFDNLDIIGRVPYVELDPDFGDGESGIGDASLGFEVVVYEDIFHYPYIMPHVDVTYDTGDEDKGLGEGETYVTLGITIGTTVNDMVHFSLDGSYELRDEVDDIASVGAAIVWDLSKEFALTTEVQWTDEDDGAEINDPITFLGGMSYEPTENVAFIFSGGVATESDKEEILTGKVAISF
ncbi:MAG: transporter [Verrucomicrobia bacterium]|nr:transporter [Verrucomicrobiota bacterium]